MFSLLDGFAKGRNMYAPIIYKTLTFILVECYTNLDIKTEILSNFIEIFTKYANIPISILCEPLLKQIAINLEKQDMVANQGQIILQP
mmetsp:Transcript_29766/g.45374  ORF Transcript_29766/g.45374 Transcript_29766/m.45374 type:complete len:88 (+) Transcript_29766:1786-2049(+)